MTPPNPLTVLAERVERLTGPCRETDGDIANALTLYPAGWRRGAKEASATAHWFNDKTGQSWSAPSFTASLDAAMTLCPENMEWECGTALLVNAAWAGVISLDGRWQAKAATPALALTAASLRARAASEPPHGR